MDSRFESQGTRDMASSLSKPTDARSSAMAGHENKSHKKAAKNDLTGILQFFETFTEDVKTQFEAKGVINDPMVANLENNIGKMKGTFDQITETLGSYDAKLINVLGQHQDDFWFAFKTHMSKIEKELQFLQQKSKEQDSKLTQDARIINLQDQLKWYQTEFKNLMEVKEKNDEAIAHLKDQCKNLGIMSEEMRTQVKAAKRQNKLLGVALQKAQNHKEELSNLGQEISVQQATIRREAIEMPNLMFSPFLPYSEQLDVQRMSEYDDLNQTGGNYATMSPINDGQLDMSLQRLNSDIPQAPIFPEEAVVGAAANNGVVVQQQQQLQQTSEPVSPEKDIKAIATALQVGSLYDSKDIASSQISQQDTKRMESIPEEISKANLYSSQSKVGMMQHAQGLTFNGAATNVTAQQLSASFGVDQMQQSSVLQQYVKDLVSAGKTEAELNTDLETYYDTLAQRCDNEILDLKEELEFEKAAQREQAADEVYLKANEIDELSNVFIDCIHAHRKSLRQQLVKMRFKDNQHVDEDGRLNFDQSHSSFFGKSQSKNRQPNLLQTYLRIVKTGAPEEIEKFSQIERQKLVELLVTNQELLNFMFDKMFKNNYDPKEREQMLLSKMTLSETAFDPGSLEQLQHDDPLELLQRSTELRRAHEQSHTATKYQRMLNPVGSTGASRTKNIQQMPYYNTHVPKNGLDQQMTMQKLMLDRKQRSMAIGVGRSGVIDEITASPLLLQKNAQGERQTLRGYDSFNEPQQQHGSLKQTQKVASDFGNNVFHHLSNVDTDKMQNQFLSNKEVDPSKPSQKSIVLPSIGNRQGTQQNFNSHVVSPGTQKSMHKTDVSSRSSKGYMTAMPTAGARPSQKHNMASNAGRSKKSLLQGKSARQLRALSTRPLIHIREGKLLLSGPTQQHQTLSVNQRQ